MFLLQEGVSLAIVVNNGLAVSADQELVHIVPKRVHIEPKRVHIEPKTG